MTENEFYNNIDFWISKDKSTWNHITYLAYFCFKYEKVNGIRFRLVRARKGPTMGKEAADFAKLFRIFAPENYSKLSSSEKKKIRAELNIKIYNYINWVFDYKFRHKLGSVNGTKLFHIPSLIVEFERMYLAHQKKRKGSDKMKTLLSWCKEKHPDILNMHNLEEPKHLKMLEAYAKSYNLSEDESEIKVINKAKEIGIKF